MAEGDEYEPMSGTTADRPTPKPMSVRFEDPLDMDDIFEPFVTAPHWCGLYTEDAQAKQDKSKIGHHKELWRRLREAMGEGNPFSLMRSDIESSMVRIHAKKGQAWGLTTEQMTDTPGPKWHRSWQRAVALRVKAMMRHIGKALNQKQRPRWVVELFDHAQAPSTPFPDTQLEVTSDAAPAENDEEDEEVRFNPILIRF